MILYKSIDLNMDGENFQPGITKDIGQAVFRRRDGKEIKESKH